MAFVIVVPLFALLGLGLVALFVVPPLGTVMLGIFVVVTVCLFAAAQVRTRRRRRVMPKPTPSHWA